ncbi:cysteinyl-tRNA synthetase [Caloranaerobacter azorensis H53214]|uniref:Cysteine--tRNA ligase n=1 Tax=Caloranaerobacter azorensis H53214 TaxID=1156417 RepID=A0A096BG11_9FIRM|nr:cysteine--tRNA ligase [Caloranaerobacter azorensis]KGG79658.1 cysteinyl-tRNA synthetase [Caloranaerobacter azorensis H53214]
MKLYNTLTRTKEEFKPINPNKITMYVCGPTVYNYIHVGNARPLVVFDTLRRYFEYKGYDVDYIVNFTDIDDKMIKKANEEETTVREIADSFIKEYFIDAEGLSLKEETTIHPRATEHISDIIEFIKGLEEKGYAYNVNGNVYFDTTKMKDYGKLSKKNIEELIAGARIEVNQEKRNPTDFALWKKEKLGEPSWDSPWGKGRPGWHIECSVMAKKFLGDTIDIHAGGEDLQFPHHENEIAQSESLNGKPFANYWLHNAMVNVDDQKMSKSKMNFFTVREISREFDLEVLRFFILSAHYRSPINFSKELVEQAKNGLDRLYNGKRNLEHLLGISKDEELSDNDKKIINDIDRFKEKFISSMEDDLNTADAISTLFELVRYANTNINTESPKEIVKKAYDILIELSSILGILSKKEEIVDEEIIKLIEERNRARKERNYQLADKIRDELKEKGIILEDTKEGTKWRRI